MTEIWEYRVVTVVDGKYCENEAVWNDREALNINELGKQGWELVTVMNKAGHFKQAYFKRQRLPEGY